MMSVYVRVSVYGCARERQRKRQDNLPYKSYQSPTRGYHMGWKLGVILH